MPGGRPHTLDKIVATRDDGTNITAAQQVIDRVRLGLDYTEAADTAAISRTTLHSWRLAGARARATAATGAKLNASDRRYVEFLNDLESAQAEAHRDRLELVRTGSQPFTVTKVVERATVTTLPDGTEQLTVIERTTTTETKPGQWTAAAWWLERRMPALYARRLEVTGPEGGPIPVEQRAAELGASLRTYLEGAADGAAAAKEATTA